MISVALAAGLTQKQVATMMGITDRTLQKRFRAELDDAGAIANAKVASKLFSRCMKGDTIALIFWAKSRLGWNERQKLEVTGADGGPIQHETIQAEADAFTSRIAQMAARFAGPTEPTEAANTDEPPAAELTQKSTEGAAQC